MVVVAAHILLIATSIFYIFKLNQNSCAYYMFFYYMSDCKLHYKIFCCWVIVNIYRGCLIFLRLRDLFYRQTAGPTRAYFVDGLIDYIQYFVNI